MQNFAHPLELKVIIYDERDCHGCIGIIRFLHLKMHCGRWVALKKVSGLFLSLSPPLHFGVCEQSSICATVLDSTGLVATSGVCSGRCFDLTWVLTVRDSIILDECILAAF